MKQTRFRMRTAFILLLLGVGGLVWRDGSRAYAQTQYPPEVLSFADSVLYNGKVLTVDRDDANFSIEEAVAVRGGKILAVGDSRTILAMAGPETRKIDLRGRTVIPGAVDTDSDNIFAGGDWLRATQVGDRIVSTGNELEWGDESAEAFLKGNSIAGLTGEQVAANIRAIVATAKPGERIFIRAPKTYPVETRYWTYKDLDKIAPNNPLAMDFDSSAVVTNSAMMKLAFGEGGLSKDLYCVVKDKTGEPTGQFCQKAAGVIMADLRPWPRLDDVEAVTNQLRKLMAELNKVGVTALVGHASALDFIVVNNLYHRDELTMRFLMGLDFSINDRIDKLLKRVGNLVDFSLGDTVRIVGSHVSNIDSGPNVPDNILTHTPRRIIPEIPNLHGDPDGRGENQWSATTWTGRKWEELTPKERMETDWGTVMEARRLGWNFVGIHNMGSRALEIFLETWEAADHQPNILLPRYRPLALDHNINWSPETIALAARLKDSIRLGLQNVIFQQREAKGLRKEILSAQWGELLNTMQPVKDLLDSGVPVHLEGGDPWVRSPLRRIQQYVTRKDIQGRVWGARQAIDRKTALVMNTRWGARFVDEKDLGSIEPGKLADLVVLDGDFLAVPDDQIDKIPVVMTMMGGKVVYEQGK